MDPSAVILCTTMLLLNGGSCHLIPQPPDHDSLTSVDQHKRQNPTELQQCITAKLNFAFRRNTSRFVSDCRLAAIQAVIIDRSDVINLKSRIYTTFPTFCIPECGDVVLDAYKACGYLSVSLFPGIEKFTTSLCSTNENGDKCYRHYADAMSLHNFELSCYNYYTQYRTCRPICESEISRNVSEQGCCFNVYYNLISGLPDADDSRRNIYDICNYNLPTVTECKNIDSSPSIGSTPLASTILLILVVLLCRAIYIAGSI